MALFSYFPIIRLGENNWFLGKRGKEREGKGDWEEGSKRREDYMTSINRWHGRRHDVISTHLTKMEEGSKRHNKPTTYIHTYILWLLIHFS